MKIKVHNKSLTNLASLMCVDREDCAAWVEELLMEIREIDKPDGHTLGEELSEEELTELTQEVMGHYDRESEILYPGTKQLISELIIF